MRAPIRIRAAVLRDVVAHANEDAPDECCGLLVGAAPEAQPGAPALIDEAVRAANLERGPTRYHIDPVEHIRLQKRLRGTRRVIAGAYHSHTRSAAIPSESDLREAYYPDFVYLIVSVVRPHGPEVRAWRIAQGTATELELAAVPDGVG